MDPGDHRRDRHRPAHEFQPARASGVPSERFSFTLILHFDQQLADAGLDRVPVGQAERRRLRTALGARDAAVSGHRRRVRPGRPVSAAANAAGLGQSASQCVSVPVSEVPVVLFVWGPLRIVPVRVTGLTVKETLYDVLLNPTHAEVEISLTVLTPDEVAAVNGPMTKIASMAYNYNQGLRQARAAENLAQSAASILGMVPISL